LLQLAALAGIIIFHVGDLNGNTIYWEKIGDVLFEKFGIDDPDFGAIVVHVGAGIRLSTTDSDRPVGWFENSERTPEGGVPSFRATALQFANWEDHEDLFPRIELPE
jgi:hypothetical protein